MRRIEAAWFAAVLAGLLTFLGGCAGGPGEPLASPDDPPPPARPIDPAQAQQLADEARRLVTTREPAPDALWMNDTIGRDARATPQADPRPGQAVQAEVLPAQPDEPPSAWGIVGPDTALASPLDAHADAPAADQGALLDRLIEQVTAGQGGKLGNALRAAAVLATESDRQLPDRLLAGLTDDEKQRVRRFHGVVAELMASLARGDTPDLDALTDRLAGGVSDGSSDPASIGIGTFKLCTSVRGFGVYEPFSKDVFLAGRANKLIVYLELDNYTSQTGADGQHVVRLSQELELYDDGGLVVWRHTPVAIRDEARRQRRDFFTCQLVELPARLTVGKFYLKARVIDEATGHRAERSIPLEVVADYGLATQAGRNVPLGG
jgi:hypothetical protein